jgi:hypothetical protein
MIVIRCPNTGREISTGLEADARTYQRVPVFFSRTYCPTCRTDHEWFAKDAWVRNEPEIRQQAGRMSLRRERRNVPVQDGAESA